MMTILYLHGYLSSNQSEKVDYLKQKGFTVFNPKLLYKTKSDKIFKVLENIVTNHKFNLLIGSSMGGFLAYYLGNKHHVPTLLFNPSLAPNKNPKPFVEKIENSNIFHTLVFGSNDTVVPNKLTLQFLEKTTAKYKIYYESHEHRTPLGIFKKYADLVVGNLLSN